ncbi:MAG: thiamine diphosphokinase [Lachnospiraceae bacterium]|nr:thiamine diphosphokinase [Lachnospiraceae bacterium]
MSKCIIMCAGEFEPLVIEKEEGDLLIAADNGLSYLQKLGVFPDVIIGDFDSLGREGRRLLEEIKEESPDKIITLPKEKDDTDTIAAIREGLRRGYKTFYLYSALGGRLDHTFANIQALNFIKEHDAQGYIMSEKEMIFLIRNETRKFHKGFSGGFSLFSLGDRLENVSISGMKYELENAVITNGFPIGVSNEILGENEAVVTVGNGTALAIVRWE